MSIYIHDIVTAVPDNYYLQEEARDIMKKRLGAKRSVESVIHRIYSQSGIEKRHVVRKDYDSDNPDAFLPRALSSNNQPTTAERNSIYKDESLKLFTEVADQLLRRNPQIKKEEITHVITVSCTGFYAPGPDFEVVRHLGLSPSTQRYHIGFMGCYAMFPALKMAKSFCEADPGANVLVVSAELCTLHLQAENDIDNLIAASVFADGCSGVLVSSKNPSKPSFRLDAFASSLAYEGEQDMAWTIGDTGFNMVLSRYVPSIIEANIEDVLSPLFKELDITKDDISIWALHPGGRAIIDKVEEALQLSEHQVKPSRITLANYGNMSSATILFVLNEVLNSAPENNSPVLTMAFGPGLTIETGVFTFTNGN